MTEKELNDSIEMISRISRQVKLIKEWKNYIQETGQSRLDLIDELVKKININLIK